MSSIHPFLQFTYRLWPVFILFAAVLVGLGARGVAPPAFPLFDYLLVGLGVSQGLAIVVYIFLYHSARQEKG